MGESSHSKSSAGVAWQLMSVSSSTLGAATSRAAAASTRCARTQSRNMLDVRASSATVRYCAVAHQPSVPSVVKGRRRSGGSDKQKQSGCPSHYRR